MSDEELQKAAKAFVDLYEEVDGVSDELSRKDYRLVQEYYDRYLAAKEVLRKHRPNCPVCGVGYRIGDEGCRHNA